MRRLCVCDKDVKFDRGSIVYKNDGTIDINFKFKGNTNATTSNMIPNPRNDVIDLKFSHENFTEIIYFNDNVHECLKSLIKNAMNVTCDENGSRSCLISKPENDDEKDSATAEVTVHQSHQQDDESNPKRIPSLKSSHSMENLLKKKSDLGKAKANSVDMLDQNDSESEYIENGESIELIFISDEFVNKAQKSDSEVIVLDREYDKRRDSLINKKKIVIITDEYKDKVLRNNSIKITNNKCSSKNTKRNSKTYSTSFCEDEPIQDNMEKKEI